MLQMSVREVLKWSQEKWMLSSATLVTLTKIYQCRPAIMVHFCLKFSLWKTTSATFKAALIAVDQRTLCGEEDKPFTVSPLLEKKIQFCVPFLIFKFCHTQVFFLGLVGGVCPPCFICLNVSFIQNILTLKGLTNMKDEHLFFSFCILQNFPYSSPNSVDEWGRLSLGRW